MYVTPPLLLLRPHWLSLRWSLMRLKSDSIFTPAHPSTNNGKVYFFLNFFCISCHTWLKLHHPQFLEWFSVYSKFLQLSTKLICSVINPSSCRENLVPRKQGLLIVENTLLTFGNIFLYGMNIWLFFVIFQYYNFPYKQLWEGNQKIVGYYHRHIIFIICLWLFHRPIYWSFLGWGTNRLV